jgi:hypothetical protein
VVMIILMPALTIPVKALSSHNALKINLMRAREVCPKKAQICLLSYGKSQISSSQATFDGILNTTSLYHQTPTQHLVERKN